MHILTAINNNVSEWAALLESDSTKPRLPLPYAFGGAFLNAGHSLSAIDIASGADTKNIDPFKSLFYKKDLYKALKNADVGVLWGTDALKFVSMQALNPYSKKDVLYFSYTFPSIHPSFKQRCLNLAVRILAREMKGIVLMTGEQVRKARSLFGSSVPVIRLRCGIDTKFYRHPSTWSDVPECYRAAVELLLKEPYVILPGDELRFNNDAITFVQKSGINLVRISQYGHKSGTLQLKQRIIRDQLDGKVFVFEKISYAFLRFLLQHATAYAGLVDSSWQPAGWTVACEALASGLPMVLYDGLVFDEMQEAGVPSELIDSVPMGDVDSFTMKLSSLVEMKSQVDIAPSAIAFAARELDFEKTAPIFVRDVERLFDACK